VSGTAFFVRADQTGRLDASVVLCSLYPVITVLLAVCFLKERFTRLKLAGIAAAVAAVPLIALK
jgi:drug/metabolite transporter (DMT)-like permease